MDDISGLVKTYQEPILNKSPHNSFFCIGVLFVLLLTNIDLNRLCSLINKDGVTHSHQHNSALQGREGFRKKIKFPRTLKYI